MDQLGDARVYLFDVIPRQLLTIASSHLTPSYRKRLQRYRHGPGVFKLDWALSQPIPWTNTACSRAGTVHVAGRFEEIEASEDAVARGKHPEKPFVILAQPSLSDPSRAPQGKHTAWAYCHVPRGSNVDMTVQIEDQVARFAPGFRDVIIARSEMAPAEIERRNANYVGGDITGGVQDLRQFWTRPVASRCPYATPNPRIFICSSSTPPGVGVHGMCGWWAAQAVLKSSRRKAA
jgi:phytoene dehydrogenase-like protein